ncbi:MAG: DUF1015 domain-containing protein [Treponema sp.]|jgi:hypothetical protein|nr:DUF1015 domain-containing protein [Treponema sp.]
MNNIDERLLRLGAAVPEILLPQPDIDIGKWAVIACDQFTQDRNYWEKAKNAAGASPSALNLIFPEIFLSDEYRGRRIADIHKTMEAYLREGVFAPPRRGCVYLERTTPFHRGRRGFVMAVDLERYEWAGGRALIRSTEGTAPERLPPRMDIRRSAPLETPHILLLIDDDADSLLPGLAERVKKSPPAYRGGLMLDSGDISGWFIDSGESLAFLAEGLEALADRARTRYPPGAADETAPADSASAGAGGALSPGGPSPFLFAVGDGNHSLASAKEIWEEYKKNRGAHNTALPDHPLRYALVEVENIYDPAIQFEPIHRVLFNAAFDEILDLLAGLPGFSCRPAANRAELARLTAEPSPATRFGLVSGGRYALVETEAAGLATVSLQPLLDEFIRKRTAGAGKGGVPSIDYIHGEDAVFRLAETESGGKNGAPEKNAGRPAVGILLPPVNKAGLFETVARSGPLPRKSFSMGEALEKRFYLECRKLFV